MATEVTNFRELVRAWLTGLADLSTHIGARLFYGWPLAPPSPPLATFSMSRRVGTDYPLPYWTASLFVDLHAIKGETIDEMEDAITDSLGDSATAILTTLTNDDVRCVFFEFVSCDADLPTYSPEDGSYVFLSRRLTFRCGFHQKGA